MKSTYVIWMQLPLPPYAPHSRPPDVTSDVIKVPFPGIARYLEATSSAVRDRICTELQTEATKTTGLSCHVNFRTSVKLNMDGLWLQVTVLTLAVFHTMELNHS